MTSLKVLYGAPLMGNHRQFSRERAARKARDEKYAVAFKIVDAREPSRQVRRWLARKGSLSMRLLAYGHGKSKPFTYA